MLCGACNHVFAGTSARTTSPLKIRVHHSTLQSFQASVSAGCHLCNLISTCDGFLPDPTSDDFEDRLKNSRIEWLFLDDELLFVERAYSASGKPSSSFSSQAIFRLIEAEKAGPAASAFRPTPTTLSESSLATARKWLEKCLKEHCNACAEACRETRPFFPNRIVDVGVTDSPSVVKVVVPTQAIDEPYATLSHCWGDSQTVRLVRSNLEAFQKGIDVQFLPKTFQQAIFVTKKLGLRYIWIDSLCILQDCADDWRSESAIMRHIYLRGALNIAASAASSDHEGLSFSRNPQVTRHIPVSITWTSADLLDHKPRGTYYLFNGDIWDREVEFAPLNGRGWVLQERLLAPRVLHFGRNQIYWQCNTIFHSEMFPYDLRTKDLGPHVPRVTSNFMRCFHAIQRKKILDNGTEQGGGACSTQETTAIEDYRGDTPYIRWSELVNAYSATALTRSQDKLIAVQALAETMRDATGDAYVAGLWKSHIIEDVLWRTDVDALLPSGARHQAVRRPRLWRAPTWSWASLDCRIEARSAWHYSVPGCHDDGKSLVREMIPEVEGFDGVDTGQLNDAWMRVKGLLYRNSQPLSLRILENPLSLYRAAEDVTPWSLKIVLDEWEPEIACKTEYVVHPGTLFFPVGMPIAGTVEGLMLEPMPGLDGHFKRTAYFEVDILLFGGNDILEGMDAWENASDLITLEDGIDVKGRALYCFTLV